MRRSLCLLLVGSLAACSLATSLSELTAGGDGVDGGAASSGIDDGSTDRVTPATTPCTGLPATTIFCTDFDGAPLEQDWDDRPTTRGTVGVDSAAVVSPPRSLLAATESIATSGNSPQAFVIKRFPSLTGRRMRLTMRFSIRVEQTDPTNDAVLATLRLDGPSDDHALQIVGKGTSASGAFKVSLIEQNAANDTVGSAPLTGFPAAGVWARVEIEMTLRDPSLGAANEWRVVVNGTSLATQPFAPSVNNGVPTISVGVSWARTPAETWRVRYEDVSLEAAPLS